MARRCAYLPALSEAGVPLSKRIFGIGHYLRAPMIQLIGCTNVLLQGYRVQNTPFWQHHPVHCRNLVIRNVEMHSHGPNSDGFDPEACDHVLVDGCTFDTGDDCIAIKAGKDLDTQYGPSQNIVIQNSIMHSGHGGVTWAARWRAASRTCSRKSWCSKTPTGKPIRSTPRSA
jgi:polygalacturonase